MPDGWLVSRACEEFPGLGPMAVEHELRSDPEGRLLEIMELRAYARAKRLVESATDTIAPTAMTTWVMRVAEAKVDARG